MRYLNKITIFFLSTIFVISSCNTDELTDLNINPNAVNEIDMNLLLTQVQLLNNNSGYSFEKTWWYLPGYMQYMAATHGVLDFGDKYLNSRPEDLAGFYEDSYQNAVLNVNEIIEHTKEDPAQKGLYAVARIMKVLVMHRLTDFYGDIPYSEAAKGFSEGILQPKFDPQEGIYQDMLKELEESVSIIKSGASLTKPEQDIFYKGNMAKWNKFANSLMLRLGMRMSKVSPNGAKQWVAKAISGGLMESNDDNTVLLHANGPSDINWNPLSFLNTDPEVVGSKMSRTFIDWLKNNNDPRLMIYTMGIGPKEGPFDADPANQKGMPNGYDEITIKQYEGLPETQDVDLDLTYSTINVLLVSRTSPSIYMSHAEVEFLLAEASQLGWISDDAAAHYNAGVTSALKQYAIFDPSFEVSDTEVQEYLEAHPYNQEKGLEMIGEQYWAVNFTNPAEAWANWRRTGFPVLEQIQYKYGSYDDKIPRRFQYPLDEPSVNTKNYNEVIARQGPDTWQTRIWWDK